MTLREKLNSYPKAQKQAFKNGLMAESKDVNPYKNSKKWGISFYNAYESGRTWVKIHGKIFIEIELW